jgi:aerobic-type carbon monoxide dehydrogenase small subunit (CoxS/CutS family)
MSRTRVSIEINGQRHEREIEPRLLLSDFIRHEAGLTGTHVGCEHGVCGACTVHLDGRPVRSCLMLAVTAEGHALRTVEDLAGEDGELHPLQEAFRDCHGVQCGFCTPGFLMSIEPLLAEVPDHDDRRLREALSGNLCRCTGYQNIVAATALAAERLADDGPCRQEAQMTVAAPAAGVWPTLAGLGLDPGAVAGWSAALRLVDEDDDTRTAGWELDLREARGSGHLTGTLRARVRDTAGTAHVALTLEGRLAAPGSGAARAQELLDAVGTAVAAALADRMPQATTAPRRASGPPRAALGVAGAAAVALVLWRRRQPARPK